MVSLLRWLRLVSVWHACEQPKAIVAVALVFNYSTGPIARRGTGVFVAPRPLAQPRDCAVIAELRAQSEAQSLNLMMGEELVQMFLLCFPIRDSTALSPHPLSTIFHDQSRQPQTASQPLRSCVLNQLPQHF